jgi:CRISPR-associated protein Csb1
LFGFWDSTGPRGGLGAKVQRSLVSEIVGYEAEKGKRSSSRIDPLQIENNVEIYKKTGGGWTFDAAEAEQNKGAPVKLRPSEINHGNITPSLKHEDKNTRKQVLNHGGVTLAYALQHTVLSLAALRRLRFPISGITTPEIDGAARCVLAALGLAAICLLDEDGFDLRSRCLLDGKPGTFEFVGRGETSEFDMDSNGAAHLLAKSAEAAKDVGLPWPEERVTLQPSANLSRLVVESRRRSMASSAEE